MPTVLVTPADVRAFASASHDQSPLHVDAPYARRTSFARPVVHGVLATLGAIGCLAPREPAKGAALAKITIDFQGPVFEGTSYEVVIEDSGAKAKISVRDGTRVLLRASLVFGPGAPVELVAHEAARPRTEARADEVIAGPAVDVAYAPSPAGLEALIERLGLRARGLASGAVAAMMAASYVVGMERPGAQALFARLQLAFVNGGDAAPAHIRATIAGIDERFAMATLDVDLCGAAGELRALVRPRPIALDAARMDRALADAKPGSLDGKTVVVIGGGRGLGAALALAFAKCGARVVATFAGSRGTAEALAALDARIAVVQADATDAEACVRVVEALGGSAIDVLVLSASPAVLPLALAEATIDRVRAFVDRSLAMALVPLAVLGRRSLAAECKLVAISSAYVAEPPEDFAHYLAAKGALEGVCRGAAKDRELPLVIVRPPRVLTDMTNTAFGTEDALYAEDVAVKIVTAVVSQGDGVAVVESFAWPLA